MGLFGKKEKKVTFSPEFVRAQSRQNLSEMSRIVDGLYSRATTAAEREALCAMEAALKEIRPNSEMVPEVLEVEELLNRVLLDYNANLDKEVSTESDAATIDIINRIVDTRRKMSGCTMDTDYKRGLKTYLKANKGMGKKKELKEGYDRKYKSSMQEVQRYVGQSKKLGQLVKSYQLGLRKAKKNEELKTLEDQIQKLAAKYKKSTDQAERDRLNTEYQTLLRKKKNLHTDLLVIEDAIRNVGTVENLIDALANQEGVEQIDNTTAEEVAALSNKLTEGLRRIQKHNTTVEDSYSSYDRAMDTYDRRSSDMRRTGETLDSVILRDQGSALDDIASGTTVSSGEAASLDDLIGLDD